jgi:sulfur carrier protein
MQKTIPANNRKLEWPDSLTLFDVFRSLGYTLRTPMVMVRVNGELIKKTQWKEYVIPEEADIRVLNVFCGG